MSYTWADFRRNYVLDDINAVGFDELCKMIRPEDRLKELEPKRY